jgi:protein subunit release factor A
MSYYKIPHTNEELLDECDVDTYCSSGKGGQNVNRRATAVRLTHRPSGIVVAIQNERHQYRNKQIALEVLRMRLEQRNRRRRPRIPTRISRSADERRLQSKKHHSSKKRLRQKPGMQD